MRELTADRLASDEIRVDAICGGFPCQDVSESHVKGRGLDGEHSGLWREFARIVGEVRPRFVFVENVSNLLGRGFGDILGALASLGYDAEWHSIRACDLGAPHERERVWIIAYAAPAERWPLSRSRRRMAGEDALLSWKEIATGFARFSAETWDQPWPAFIETDGLLDDGLSTRLGEFNAYANAVVPQIPELIGRALLSIARSAREVGADEGGRHV